MTFVQVSQSLVTHRKTLRLARLLGIDRYAVVGRLVALWSWCLDNALDGCLGNIEPDILADVMGWDGKPSELVEGLLTVGFLELREDQQFWIHDWDDHMGGYMRTIEQGRKNNRERQQRYRDRHTPHNDEHTATVTVTPALRNADITGYIRSDQIRSDPEQITVADVGGVGGDGPPDGGGGSADTPTQTDAQSLAILSAQVAQAAHLNGHDRATLARCLTRFQARASPEDLIAEAGKAAEWIRDHPKHRMNVRYLDNWFKRALKDEEGSTHGAVPRSAASNGRGAGTSPPIVGSTGIEQPDPHQDGIYSRFVQH